MNERTNPIKIAIVNEGDIVTKELIKIIEERKFPVESIDFIAPAGTEGKILHYKNESRIVTTIYQDSFVDIDLAFFLLPKEEMDEVYPLASSTGTFVIDVKGALTNYEKIPLTIPGINTFSLTDYEEKIVCVPSSLSIQLSTILHPIQKKYGLSRVIVSTYQSVSNKGEESIDELARQTISLLNFQEIDLDNQNNRIAFNCLLDTDRLDHEGYSKEEKDVELQVKRILKQDSLKISINNVFVPVFHCDCLSVNIETVEKIPPNQLKNIFSDSENIISFDNHSQWGHPTSNMAANRDEIFVARIREDRSTHKGINLWCVMDNLRKGAALTAVQIAEEIIRLNH